MVVQCTWLLLTDDDTMQMYAVLLTFHTKYGERSPKRPQQTTSTLCHHPETGYTLKQKNDAF
jgi:hypothetical protein